MYAAGALPGTICHAPCRRRRGGGVHVRGQRGASYHRSIVSTELVADVFDWMIPNTVPTTIIWPTTELTGMFTPSVVNVVAVGAVAFVPA
jgi:hypothetical protein